LQSGACSEEDLQKATAFYHDETHKTMEKRQRDKSTAILKEKSKSAFNTSNYHQFNQLEEVSTKIH
jgi:hypothetical protein